MTIARLVAAFAAAVAVLVAGRSAGALPPDPDAMAIVHEDGDGRRTPILDPRGLAVYNDLGHGLQPEITIERFGPLAYDLIFTFDNDTGRYKGMGRIDVGVITLGTDFEWLNLNRRCEFIDAERRGFNVQIRNYPSSLYAPVGVLRNDDFAVGVSLLYDILQNRHDVNVRLGKPGGAFASGPGGAGYSIGFDLGNPASGANPTPVFDPGYLHPGEQRTYRVAVRAVKLDSPPTVHGPQHWLAAIEPYRQHFEALYGGVAYDRDTRPVRAQSIANTSTLNPDNTLGFNGGDRNRPDLNGWGPLVNRMLRPLGFERTMLWAPGGLYYTHRDNNFPSQFMSQLLTTDKLSTAFNERVGLPRLANAGQDLGLWWGRSSRVVRQWDSAQWEPLDLAHQDRIDLALYEMHLANDAGATTIGLDAFLPSEMPVWQQYEWILELRRRYPDTKFILEPMACDVMHSLSPTFVISWKNGDRTGQPETRFRVRNPHYLADYLLPGHEIWGYFRYSGTRLPENITRLQQDADYIAGTGHVPVMSTLYTLTNPAAAEAHATWVRTVPDALKTEAHRTADPADLPIPPDEPTDDPTGDGDDSGGDDTDWRDEPTRPLMLPNGRVIRVPIYGGK
jgi:hypothetical protein